MDRRRERQDRRPWPRRPQRRRRRAARPANDQIAFPAVEFPVLRPEPEVGDGWVRFQQTVGGRIGLPVRTTASRQALLPHRLGNGLDDAGALIRADGSSEGRLVAASPFPHHSVYGPNGELVSEHGVADYDGWYRESFEESPWGGGELEEELDEIVLRSGGVKLQRRRLGPGETLVEQGEAGTDMFMLLDGVLEVEIDGETVASSAPARSSASSRCSETGGALRLFARLGHRA